MIKLLANILMEKEYSYSCAWSSGYQGAATTCWANSYTSKQCQDI